jgi:UDP:flavonoid glycosyltransferase YjiC (YdhE family)
VTGPGRGGGRTAPAGAIAYFVTPHGFGHAARAAAVFAALRRRAPGLRAHLFTTVPRWFFRESLAGGFVLHPLEADVGLVQDGPLAEDLPATLRRLAAFYPPGRALVDRLAARLQRLGCRLAVCDIAPLGIAVARRAGLPSVLVENFTWDWIYRGYAAREPRLAGVADRLAPLFAGADCRIQTEPVCVPAPGAHRVGPVSRRPRSTRRAIREALGVPHRTPLVLVTMGGVPHGGFATARLRAARGVAFVLAGGAERRARREGNLLLLPHHAGFYHPDLVGAADAVVGKLGYSTLAETWRAGIPFGYVPRPLFRESALLERWVRERNAGLAIGPGELSSGGWVERLPALLAIPRRRGRVPDGAAQAARIILQALAT